MDQSVQLVGVDDLCLQSMPCQHYVTLKKGTTKLKVLLYGSQIKQILERSFDFPDRLWDHFKYYKSDDKSFHQDLDALFVQRNDSEGLGSNLETTTAVCHSLSWCPQSLPFFGTILGMCFGGR